MYEIMHARMYKTCMYLCTVFNRSDIIMYVCLYVCVFVCYRSGVISRRVVGPSTYIHSAHTDEVRLSLHQ